MLKHRFTHRVSSLIAAAALVIAAMPVTSCSDDKEETIPDNGGNNTQDPIGNDATTVEMARAWEAYYFYPDYINKDFGNYYFELATGEVGVAGFESLPLNPGDYMLLIDINTRLCDDRANIVLPEGTYTAADKVDKNNTFNITNTMAVYNVETTAEGQSRIHYYKFTDGTIEVKHTADGGYIIDCHFTGAENGEKWHFTYTGEIPFEDKTGDEGDWWGFDENIDLTGKAANFVYLEDYSSDNVDNYTLRLFSTDALTPDQKHVNVQDAYMIKFDLYTAHGAGIAGTYTVATGSQPGTVYPGGRFGAGASGSYIEKVRDDWEVRYALLADGTVNIVENSDGTYSVTVDGTTPKGRTVKMTYTGEIADNTDFVPKYSTLNYDVEFNPLACTLLYYFGDLYGTGASNYYVAVADQNAVLLFDLYAATGDASALPTGSFTVSDDHTPGTMQTGTVDGMDLVPCIYVLYASDGESIIGYAPIHSGTLDITHGTSGYTFTFDLKDDAEEPNRIYGTCTIPDLEMPEINDATQETAASRAFTPASRIKAKKSMVSVRR